MRKHIALPVFVGASIVAALAVLLAPIASGTFGKPDYRFVSVTYNNIKKTISSSGPLSPITKVEVGSQISGSVKKVYVDYNDHVEKEQVLAIVDLDPLKTDVVRSEGQLTRSSSELKEAQINLSKDSKLFEKKTIAESDFLVAQARVCAMEGQVKVDEANLERAKLNLAYGTIRSPIAGTVLVKNVEEGQTLAANFMTPRLFEIAEEISHLEILVAVDECDIGQIQNGQKVQFTVQAYPGKTFYGNVKKIRLAAEKLANVVNFPVVVSVNNTNNLLLPGMTAEVDFVIGQRNHVLSVPKTALSFVPDKVLIARLEHMPDQKIAQIKAAVDRAADLDDNTGQIWYMDEKGRLSVAEVKLGISDGSNTEVLSSGPLHESMQVVAAVVTNDDVAKVDKSGNRKLVGPPPGGPGGPGPGGP